MGFIVEMGAVKLKKDVSGMALVGLITMGGSGGGVGRRADEEGRVGDGGGVGGYETVLPDDGGTVPGMTLTVGGVGGGGRSDEKMSSMGGGLRPSPSPSMERWSSPRGAGDGGATHRNPSR